MILSEKQVHTFFFPDKGPTLFFSNQRWEGGGKKLNQDINIIERLREEGVRRRQKWV